MILDTRILGFDSDSFNTHYNSYAISFPPGLQARQVRPWPAAVGGFLCLACEAEASLFWQSNARCATNKYFQIIGSIHDIESYFGIDNTFSLNVQIFFSHWGHLAIIFL